MVSEEEMRKIMEGVRCIGPNNAGVKEAAHLLAEAMKEDVVYESTGVADYDGCCVRLGRGTELILGSDDEWDILDGQQYHVIVTREGMGDGKGD